MPRTRGNTHPYSYQSAKHLDTLVEPLVAIKPAAKLTSVQDPSRSLWARYGWIGGISFLFSETGLKETVRSRCGNYVCYQGVSAKESSHIYR